MSLTTESFCDTGNIACRRAGACLCLDNVALPLLEVPGFQGSCSSGCLLLQAQQWQVVLRDLVIYLVQEQFRVAGCFLREAPPLLCLPCWQTPEPCVECPRMPLQRQLPRQSPGCSALRHQLCWQPPHCLAASSCPSAEHQSHTKTSFCCYQCFSKWLRYHFMS